MTDATYSLTVDANGNWAIMRTQGSSTCILPERFPHKRYSHAKKLLAKLTGGN